ncbi:hypothetical protein AC791_17750 [Klebsiella sp. RIT-PI-d]|nr:hypothetical protein AC791_17750 [Klebsiella sp. RIT-PI-d]
MAFRHRVNEMARIYTFIIIKRTLWLFTLRRETKQHHTRQHELHRVWNAPRRMMTHLYFTLLRSGHLVI